MTALSGKDLLGGGLALKTERVPVPELGEDAEVLVREMTAAAREHYSDGLLAEDPDDPDEAGAPKRKPRIGQMYARLVAFSVVDEEGKLQFSEEDVEKISGLPATVVERIAAAAGRVSGIGERALEIARKN